MKESAIADFSARFVADSTAQTEPVKGRILLSQKRLVFADGDGETTIPLSAMFDITVGHVPPNVTEFFDDTVTIGYSRDGTKRTAVVEGEKEIIDRFTNVLFRAQLNGAQATVRHPARVGGRVVDTTMEIGTVRIGDKAVRFTGLSEPFTIDLASVIDFEKERRTINDEKQLSLLVRHMPDARSVTSEITLPSKRKMNILGRYLRLEYGDLMADIRDMDVSDEEMETLIALYSSGDAGTNLARLLDVADDDVPAILGSLAEKGLVVNDSGDPSLTSMGKMMIGSRMEEINV